MGMYCFGIDVGGTSVKCGLFLTNGTLVEQWEIPTRLENNGSSILPDVADAIKTKLDERGITKDNVDGVGIGIPGHPPQCSTRNLSVQQTVVLWV